MTDNYSTAEPMALQVDAKSPRATQIPDGMLLSRFRQGDAGAFDILYARYYERICGFLRRWAGEEADDLTQETFLRLYHKPPRRCPAGLGAWLHRVAINLAYNAWRGRRRWEGHLRLFGEQTRGQGWSLAEPSPHAELERGEERSHVHRALGKLRRPYAAMLLLRYSGYSYQEIASILKVSRGSVGTMLVRAERAFRRAYESLDE